VSEHINRPTPHLFWPDYILLHNTSSPTTGPFGQLSSPIHSSIENDAKTTFCSGFDQVFKGRFNLEKPAGSFNKASDFFSLFKNLSAGFKKKKKKKTRILRTQFLLFTKIK